MLLGEHDDTQCGLKAFRSDVAATLFGRARVDGFAFDVELFALAEHLGFSVTAVPVQVANSDRSTVHVVRDADGDRHVLHVIGKGRKRRVTQVEGSPTAVERIGDRVTNIAEDVVFQATGDIEDLNP